MRVCVFLKECLRRQNSHCVHPEQVVKLNRKNAFHPIRSKYCAAPPIVILPSPGVLLHRFPNNYFNIKRNLLKFHMNTTYCFHSTLIFIHFNGVAFIFFWHFQLMRLRKVDTIFDWYVTEREIFMFAIHFMELFDVWRNYARKSLNLSFAKRRHKSKMLEKKKMDWTTDSAKAEKKREKRN